MSKGIIYYTDNRIYEPIKSYVRQAILNAKLPIVSCSLNDPIDFGENHVYHGERSYPTYISQILTCLEHSTADYVFFCEHDVLYPPSHFDFLPPNDSVFYYNLNAWRWYAGDGKDIKPYDYAIRHGRMLSLSYMCCNRKLALEHYRMRARKIEEQDLCEWRSREPRLARIWGYEPGTKKIKRGGLSDEDYDTWSSDLPIVDIRHRGTFSSPKVTLESFKHPPSEWLEINCTDIPGWDLKKMFNL